MTAHPCFSPPVLCGSADWEHPEGSTRIAGAAWYAIALIPADHKQPAAHSVSLLSSHEKQLLKHVITCSSLWNRKPDVRHAHEGLTVCYMLYAMCHLANPSKSASSTHCKHRSTAARANAGARARARQRRTSSLG